MTKPSGAIHWALRADPHISPSKNTKKFHHLVIMEIGMGEFGRLILPVEVEDIMPARGAANEKGLERMNPFEREMERKKRHLEKLKEEFGDTLASQNGAMAENEVSWEMGVFTDKPEGWLEKRDGVLLKEPLLGEEWTPERERGFIIRTRRDGMIAQLNSNDILDRVDANTTRLINIERMVFAVFVIMIIIGVKMYL